VPRKYDVRLTSAAQEDLGRIYEYIAEDSPASAAERIDELERQIATLERLPLRCSVIPEAPDVGRPYRHLIFGSYRTVFRISGRTVFVVRIVHGAQLLDLTLLDS
jgi:plasmid stabilization system protein ParE